MKKATIADVAELAGVSKATVSRYLKQENVREEIAEKIRAAIEETGYVARGSKTEKANEKTTETKGEKTKQPVRVKQKNYRFGLDFLYAEASVYALAKKMMPEYEGGFWHFIRLPDGGGYMMPDGDRFHLVNGENWFDRTVSADAAGIILTSLVINRQLWLYHDSGDAGLTHLYRMRDAQLWSHIEFHPECNAIYAALD